MIFLSNMSNVVCRIVKLSGEFIIVPAQAQTSPWWEVVDKNLGAC
nr:hypothetical protein [uncultured Desulfobacter sp.]